MRSFKNFFCSLVSLVSLFGVTSVKSSAKVPYIGLIRGVHWNYSCKGGSDLLDLVNDYVFYSNKGDKTKSFEKKLKATSQYANVQYFLPWDDVNNKKYKFLFDLDYNEDLDGFSGEYTKSTSKLPRDFITKVHAYEWYSAGIKKYREKLRSAQSANMSKEEIEYTKKLIIIMHQERMMIASDLIDNIKHNWFCSSIKLDFYTKSPGWNEKAREVKDIMERMKEPEKNTKKEQKLLIMFADEDIKHEVAKFWNKRDLENMLKQSEEKIEASHKEEYTILKKFLKELSLLTPLAPKEEEKEKLGSRGAREYIPGKWRSSQVSDAIMAMKDTCCIPDASPPEEIENESKIQKESSTSESEDPDDIEILHKI